MKFNIEGFKAEVRKQIPRWINRQNLIFLIVIAVFVVIILWSDDISHYFENIRIQEVQLTLTPTVLPGTPTPLPAEWLTSSEQTNGIVFGALIILILIIASTVIILIRDRHQSS
ncbi:MAG: hypothetical protein KA449_00675 [Pelolinea sp.]|nr:hypothetical protein [Pelolinea sp.]